MKWQSVYILCFAFLFFPFQISNSKTCCKPKPCISAEIHNIETVICRASNELIFLDYHLNDLHRKIKAIIHNAKQQLDKQYNHLLEKIINGPICCHEWLDAAHEVKETLNQPIHFERCTEGLDLEELKDIKNSLRMLRRVAHQTERYCECLTSFDCPGQTWTLNNALKNIHAMMVEEFQRIEVVAGECATEKTLDGIQQFYRVETHWKHCVVESKRTTNCGGCVELHTDKCTNIPL